MLNLFNFGSSTKYPPVDPKAIPSKETLSKASMLEVFDEEGKKVKFGSLIEKLVVVVFIRHFFCGSCLSYTQNLARVPQEALDAAGTQVILIGCGEHICIKEYRETSTFHGPIYADPTRALFRTLGMTYDTLATNPPEETRASYLGIKSTWDLVSSSWNRGWKNTNLVGKQGNIFQNGGEFVLGPGNQCTFASRMTHTMQHAPVEEVMKAARVEYQDSI
ncbi:AhpC/TSA antioxidant enzyme-domain-containing protein [Coprinopsis sp. MPI-PUGE-AT-0042]|nr:AhpC/TSA antioxidant enzyme-domain-containing protein [Coprinopsis sp. MPI-PUGE-AT-0042]